MITDKVGGSSAKPEVSKQSKEKRLKHNRRVPPSIENSANPRFGVICKKMPPEAASSFLCGCSVEWNAGEVRVRVEIWFVKVFFTM